MKKSIIILFVITLFVTNCSKEEKETVSELPNISVVDISQESDWDYWVIGKKDYYFLKANNELPESVLYHSTETNYDYSILFTESGLIDKVIVDGYIFVFRNFNGNSLDVGIIHPNGDIQILRKIETEYNWDESTLSGKSSLSNKQYGVNSWEDLIIWTGRVVSGVPCALSAVGFVGTVGVSTPALILSCTSFAVALASDISANEFGEDKLTNLIYFGDKFQTGFACGTKKWIDCASGIISFGADIWANAIKDSETKWEQARTIEAILLVGYGDVQVTLTWDNETDLDLHVIDPNGYEVSYENTTSSYGMTLDVDDTDGIGPENIFWSYRPDTPLGNYKILVNYFDGISNSSNYMVTITAFNITKTYTGTILRDQTISIIDLDPLSPEWFNKSANIKVISVSKSMKTKK
tara:strand:+ start:3803 stop:5029 length:1227 start_codon:yes stop_codon:yes gene_type:complete